MNKGKINLPSRPRQGFALAGEPTPRYGSRLPVPTKGDSGALGGPTRPHGRALTGETAFMRIKALLNHILEDDALTRGLGDPEARILVEWLVERTERLAQVARDESEAAVEVKGLCRRARGIRRFVSLWCYSRDRRAAMQLAASERFSWPLPASKVDPCELMHVILVSEASRFVV
jgi:hypothetical protein